MEPSAGKQEHPTDPSLISQRMLCFPRGDARAKRLSLYAGFSHSAANTRLRQATKAAHRTDSDFPGTAMLSQRFSAWHELHFAAASSERLCVLTVSRQGKRAAGELVSVGLAFPGSKVTPGVHGAMPNSADTVTTLQRRAWPSMALYAYYHFLV